MKDTRAVIESFFARSGANDPALVELFAESVDFYTPGDPRYFPWAGKRTRRDELLHVFELIWASRKAGSGKVRHAKLVVEGEDAVWVGIDISHEISPPAPNQGKRFSIDAAIYFTVRDGRIVRLHAIEDMTKLAQDYGYL